MVAQLGIVESWSLVVEFTCLLRSLGCPRSLVCPRSLGCPCLFGLSVLVRVSVSHQSALALGVLGRGCSRVRVCGDFDCLWV